MAGFEIRTAGPASSVSTLQCPFSSSQITTSLRHARYVWASVLPRCTSDGSTSGTVFREQQLFRSARSFAGLRIGRSIHCKRFHGDCQPCKTALQVRFLDGDPKDHVDGNAFISMV